MKKFIKKIILFSIPLLLIGIGAEIFLRFYPNTFNTKAKYFDENKKDIEVIFLGSSHTMDGVNPKYFSLKVANLGYASQDFQIDSALISHYLKDLKSLKQIVWEVDYISLYKTREPDYFRYPWYKIYYNIDFGKGTLINYYSMYSTSPDFFNQYIQRALFTDNLVNKYGFNEAEDEGKFSRMKYDSLAIEAELSKKDVQVEANVIDENNLERNLKLVNYVEDLCRKNNIQLIFMNYPMHYTYYRNIENKKMYVYWKKFMKEKSSQGYKVLDFERNKNFSIKDFANESHLNKNGAAKLSKILNDLMIKNKRISTHPTLGVPSK